MLLMPLACGPMELDGIIGVSYRRQVEHAGKVRSHFLLLLLHGLHAFLGDAMETVRVTFASFSCLVLYYNVKYDTMLLASKKLTCYRGRCKKGLSHRL